MRTFLGIALSLAVFVPQVSAQTATPPAPPGGVGGAPTPVQGVVPAVPAPAPLAPVVAQPVPMPPAVESAAPIVPTPVLAPPLATPTPPAPSPNADPSGPLVPDAVVPVAPAPTPALAPLPSHSRTVRRQVPREEMAAPKRPTVRRDAGAPFAVAVGGGMVWDNDPGYLLVGEKRRPTFDVMASYDLLQPSKHLVVSLGASLRRSRASEGDLSIFDDTLQAELIARLATSSWFWPHARASVGAAFTRVEIGNEGAPGSLTDRDVGLASSFGGGFTLRTPTRALESPGGRLASLSLGVLCEAGYSLTGDATFVATPSGGASGVERSAVRLGSLSRSAPYLRIMAIARF